MQQFLCCVRRLISLRTASILLFLWGVVVEAAHRLLFDRSCQSFKTSQALQNQVHKNGGSLRPKLMIKQSNKWPSLQYKTYPSLYGDERKKILLFCLLCLVIGDLQNIIKRLLCFLSSVINFLECIGLVGLAAKADSNPQAQPVITIRVLITDLLGG